MKKKTLAVLIALLLVAGAGIYTYAKYTSSFTGTGTAEVAKWAVSLKQGNTEVDETFNLTLTPEENSNVVGNKMAPGRTATAQLILDLTGTEVTTDYEIDLTQATGLPEGMTISEVKATVEGEEQTLTKEGSKYSGTVALENGQAINKAITIDITVEWTSTNDSSDTTTGETAGTISIPVTVTASQHIG